VPVMANADHMLRIGEPSTFSRFSIASLWCGNVGHDVLVYQNDCNGIAGG
jgi:hypothetical protein